MKALLDNNLAPQLARALNALSEPKGVGVFALKEKFPKNIDDVTFLHSLANDSESWMVVTQDRLTKNPHEIAARESAGLVTFYLEKAWASQEYWLKAAQLVRWWPRMLAQAGLVSGGAVFMVPWHFSGKGTFKVAPRR